MTSCPVRAEATSMMGNCSLMAAKSRVREWPASARANSRSTCCFETWCLSFDDRCCGTKIRLSVFQAAVIRSGNSAPVGLWREPRCDVRGVCPPTTPTIRIGRSNTTPLFHPQGPISRFRCEQRKINDQRFFHVISIVGSSSQYCCFPCRLHGRDAPISRSKSIRLKMRHVRPFRELSATYITPMTGFPW